jgi:hypothetical protein
MAVQPLDPFVGEVSLVFSISLYRFQCTRQCRFWGNVSDNPHVFKPFIGHIDAMGIWQQEDPFVGSRQQASCPK